jgi:hypothetical protein
MKKRGQNKSFHFPTTEEAEEMKRQFLDEKDADCKLEAYQLFLNQAKTLQNIPPGPFFAARVMNKWKNRKSSTFWSSFEFVPRYFIEAVYVISIIIVGAVLWRHFIITNIQTGLAQNEETYILQVQWPEEVIDSKDQALQFALNLKNE